MNFFPWPHMDRFIGIVMFMNLYMDRDNSGDMLFDILYYQILQQGCSREGNPFRDP